MANFITIRCILALGATLNWKIHQMDVKMTFLNEILDVEIYMDQSEGFVQELKKDHACNFKKTLYGLQQSPRVWYHRINSLFINEGFCRSQLDHLLYVKKTGESLLVAILYVDDLIIFTSNATKLKWFKLKVEKEFEMNDLGKLHYCLGVEFEGNKEVRIIIISQKSYIKEILKSFKMEECKPVKFCSK